MKFTLPQSGLALPERRIVAPSRKSNSRKEKQNELAVKGCRKNKVSCGSARSASNTDLQRDVIERLDRGDIHGRRIRSDAERLPRNTPKQARESALQKTRLIIQPRLIVAPTRDDLQRQWKVTPSPWRDERRYRDYCKRRWEHEKPQRSVLAIALLPGAAVTIGPSVSTATSGAIDTTGASLIIACSFGLDSAFSDNQSNVWDTSITTQTLTGGLKLVCYFKASPTTNAAHTFTVTGTNKFYSAQIVALTGTHLTAPLDQQAGAFSDTDVATFQGGSITPSEDNCVVISFLGTQAGNTQIIDSPFTIAIQIGTNGSGQGSGIAYDIQTTATARNPTWTFNSSKPCAVTNASFKAAAAGGGCTGGLPLLGAGKCAAPLVGLEWLRHRKNKIRRIA